MKRHLAIPFALAALLAFSTPGSSQGSPVFLPTGDPFYVPFNDLQLSEIAGGPTLVCNGNVYLDTPYIHVCLNLDPSLGTGCGAAVQIDFRLKGGITMDLVADADGHFEKRFPLGAVIVSYLSFPLVPGLTGALVLDAELVIEGTVEAGMEVGFVGQFEGVQTLSIGPTVTQTRMAGTSGATTSSATLTSGLGSGTTSTSRQGGSAPSLTPSNAAFELSTPVLAGGQPLDLVVAIDAGLTLALEESGIPVAAPYFKMRSGIDLMVDPAGNPWWDVDGFVTPVVGMNIGPIQTGGSIQQLFHRWNVADAGGPLAGWLGDTTRWSRTYDQAVTEDLVAVTPIDDALGRGFVAVGNAAGAGDVPWMARVDEEGAVVWEQRGQSQVYGNDRPEDVHVTPTGDIAIFGKPDDDGARIDVFGPDGTFLWTRGWEDANGGQVRLSCSVPTSDGGFAFGGHVRRGLLYNPMIVRLDSAGTVVWAAEFDIDTAAGAEDAEGYDLIETSTGDFVLTGQVFYEDGPSTTRTIGSQNAFLYVVDRDGGFRWAKVVGGTGTDYARSVAEVDGGDLVFAGRVSWESEPCWIVRFSADGDFLWSRCIGADGAGSNDFAHGIFAAPGGMVVAGTTNIGSATDSWMAKLDHDGDVVWFKSVRGPEDDTLGGIRRLPDSYVAWGKTASMHPGVYPWDDDSWIVRAPIDGMLHFDPATGFDCENDMVGQNGTSDVVSYDLPGTHVGFSLVDQTTVMSVYATAVAVTLLTL